METFSALLALCKGNPPVTGGFSSQRPLTQNFDIFLNWAWTNVWANNQDAGDLRRHCARRRHLQCHLFCTVNTMTVDGLEMQGPSYHNVDIVPVEYSEVSIRLVIHLKWISCIIIWITSLFHRSPVNSPHKGQWRGALMFSLICTRINGWVNNGEAGDLRRHRPLWRHCIDSFAATGIIIQLPHHAVANQATLTQTKISHLDLRKKGPINNKPSLV